MVEIKVTPNAADQRIDRFLRKELFNYPLNFIFKLFRKKKVRVNGKRAKENQMLAEGDLIQIYEAIEIQEKEVGEVSVSPDFFKYNFHIIQEDEELLVLNKPGGVPVHPGSNQAPGKSLIELVWYYSKATEDGFKAQLVHRLDKATSGVILVAKTAAALRGFTAQMRNRDVYKEYRALVKGHLEQKKGTITLDLLRTDTKEGGAKVLVTDQKGGDVRTSITHYEVLEEYGDCSLVKVVLGTGRMHQIRTHFNHLGHPLLGDDRYGDFKWNAHYKKEHGFRDMFLHSATLRIKNGEGLEYEFNAPLTQECQKLLKELT
ncbi:MAG: RluA family pseudouridine synthase [Fibrobacterales bacterium]